MLIAMVFGGGAAHGLSIGAYVPQPSGLSADVIKSLEENSIVVQSYASDKECSDAVRSGERHACLMFSSPFGVSESNNTVTLVIDGSNLALAGVISDAIYTNLEKKSATLSTNLAMQLVNALDVVKQRNVDAKTSLVKLATTNDNAIKAARSGKGTIQALDTSFSITEIDLNAISTSTLPFVNSTGMTVANTIASLNDMLEDIRNASGIINRSNITIPGNNSASQRDLLNQDIANVSKGIAVSIDALVALNQTVNVSYANVDAALALVAGQLADTKTKLDSIVAAKSGIATNLVGVEEQLNQALVGVTTLQQSLDAIENAVNGVIVTDPDRVSRPIQAVVQPLPVKSNLSGVYPVLLIVVVAFGGLLIAPRLVSMEKHSGAQLRMALTPVPPEMQALATAITGAILVAAQSFVLVFFASLFFSAVEAPLSTFIVLLLSGLLFVLLGSAVAFLFDTEEASLFANLAIGTAALVLSGIVVPIEFMPTALQYFVKFNPVLVASSVLRQTAVFGLSVIDASGFMSIIIGIMIAGLLAWSALFFSRNYSVDGLLGSMQRK
jgi:ABC-type multidrug transport system permease subunit